MTALDADALVIGAGPAGSAAARMLALDGHRVALVDRQAFPRDKVCGDALIPDALTALGVLGLRDGVAALARGVDGIRVYAPDNSFVMLRGECRCVPRLALDALLQRAAIDAGAGWQPRLRAVGAIEDAGVVRGARFVHAESGEPVEINAPFTLLATGASSDVLAHFGMCLHSAPSATAARIYVKVDAGHAASLDHLCIAYTKSICPGYGWIFPGPDDVFNVGVGYFYDAPKLPRETNVRKLLATFLEEFPPAVALMARSRVLTPLKGAPLRTALKGSLTARPGLFVLGEAAGLTYSFSGEGIGKALESGILAAQLVTEHIGGGAGARQKAADEYSRALVSRFGERFAAYERMQRWMAYPRFVNFLARRGSAGTYVRGQLEDLLHDRGDPAELLSVRGLFRALRS